MAAKKKSGEEEPIEAIDLISLLTPAGCDGCHEGEITPDHKFDDGQLLAMAAQFDKPENKDQEAFSTIARALAKPASAATDAQCPQPEKAPAAKAKTGLHAIPPLVKIEGDSLEKIAQEISACQKCELCQTRTKTVSGAGPENARLVFIGEAPGAEEDASGIPFVGKAGQHLDKILKASGFKREEIFICNILKCRPPENRNPTLSEMLCCTPFLQRQLALIQPKLIACLGNVAIKFVISPDAPGITRIHGQWFNSIFSIPTMAMYHPSFLVRSASREKGSPNWQMWQDIQTLKKRYESA